MTNAQRKSNGRNRSGARSGRGKACRIVRGRPEQRDLTAKPPEPEQVNTPALLPTAEQIAKARAANIGNIFKKLKLGRTLSRDEREVLDEFDRQDSVEIKDSSSWPTYDSIGQAAAATGIPDLVMKRDKRNGCPAFRSNRIYFGEWLRWHFTAGDEQSIDAAYEKALGVKLDNEKKLRLAKVQEGELFPMEELKPLLLQRVVIPLQNAFASMAAAIDNRCNPGHPEIAREAIRAYIEQNVKPALAAELAKPKP